MRRASDGVHGDHGVRRRDAAAARSARGGQRRGDDDTCGLAFRVLLIRRRRSASAIASGDAMARRGTPAVPTSGVGRRPPRVLV